MKKVTWSLMIVIIFTSLITGKITAQEANFKINGDFPNLKESDSVFLCNQVMNKLVPFSRAKISNGKFTLTGNIKYENEYYVMVTTKRDTTYGKFFIEKATLNYSGLFTYYPVYKVTGGKFAKKVYASQSDPKYLELRDKVMKMEARETTNEEKIELQKLQQEVGGYISNIDPSWFEESHPLHQIFLVYAIDPKTDFEKFKKQAEYIITNYPDHPNTMNIKYALEYYVKEKQKKDEGISRKSRVGTQYTDVTTVDVDGNTHKFSEVLKKNKLVLLDFWASWCHPCRAEFPYLRIAYDKYKSQGFEIYAVSLDDNKKKWLKALEDEKTLWVNTADFEAWKSQSAKDYEITGIPYNVLVNSDGEILGESLRGEGLEELITKNLNIQKKEN